MVVEQMVDKINGNSSYDFPGSQKRKNPAVKAYENTPGSKDGAGRRAEKNSSDAFHQKEAGVILDLSGNTAKKKKQIHTVSRKKDTSWKDALRRIVAPVVRWVKDFWNADSSREERQAPAQEDLEIEESIQLQTAGEQEEAMPLPPLDVDQEPEAVEDEQLKALERQAVKSGDLRQIERFLTQNGAKRLAHNSDLLTYYDRRGKFVELDETEKHRVLFGDKNVLKL